MKNIRIIFITLLIVGLNSCIFVKKEGKEQREAIVKLSPKPIVPMQEETIRSEAGDMIVSIPDGWFFVDMDGKVSAETIAIATNPDYNLTAVFKRILPSNTLDIKFKNNNLKGVAEYNYKKKATATNGKCQLTSDYGIIVAGNLSYGTYTYSNSGGALTARTAVLKTDIDNYYEFTLIPTDVKGMSYPTEIDQENIFKSIIATMKY